MGECPDPWGRSIQPSSTSLPMSQRSSIHLGGHRCHLPVQCRKRPSTPPPTHPKRCWLLPSGISRLLHTARRGISISGLRESGGRHIFSLFSPPPPFTAAVSKRSGQTGCLKELTFLYLLSFPPGNTGGKDITVLSVPLPLSLSKSKLTSKDVDAIKISLPKNGVPKSSRY